MTELIQTIFYSVCLMIFSVYILKYIFEYCLKIIKVKKVKEFLKNNKLKEKTLSGFGVVYNKNIILENGGPMVFDTMDEAASYINGRGLGLPNFFNPDPEPPRIVWQAWDLSNCSVTLHRLEVMKREAI